jgi:hypothetical protein
VTPAVSELPPKKPKKTATAPAAPEASPTKPKKTVSFGNVQVQEYSVTLGDHPSCKLYPISLDWAHTAPKEYDLDAREKAKAMKKAREAKALKAKEDGNGGYGENKKKKRRVGKGRHWLATERHVRIAKVAGISPKEVRTLEAERRRAIHEAAHGPDLMNRVAAPAKASRGKSLRGYHEV